MTEHRRQGEAGAIRPRLRQRFPAGAEDDLPGADRASSGVEPEGFALALDERHLRRMMERHPRRPRFPEERIEDRTGRIGFGEELAGVGLPVERDPSRSKEGNRLFDGEPAQHLADRRGGAPGEVALVDPPVGDVTASPPRYEDLRPDLPGAVDADDGRRRSRGRLSPPGPGRGEESGGPDPDHGDVGLRRNPEGLRGSRLRGGFAG